MIVSGDDQLVRAAMEGQAVAFARLYDLYNGVVARRLSHLLGAAHRGSGSIDDLVQDTFERAWRGRAGFRSESPFPHWLLRIATSVARDEQRRTRRSLFRLFARSEEVDDVPAGATSLDAYADLNTVHRALKRLSPRLREVVILFELEGESLVEIAAELNISINTAGSRLRRGRAKLRRILKRAGYLDVADPPAVLCIEERS